MQMVTDIGILSPPEVIGTRFLQKIPWKNIAHLERCEYRQMRVVMSWEPTLLIVRFAALAPYWTALWVGL